MESRKERRQRRNETGNYHGYYTTKVILLSSRTLRRLRRARPGFVPSVLAYVRSGGDTSVTASPRTNKYFTARFVCCRKRGGTDGKRASVAARPLGVSRERERVGKKKPKPIAVSDASPGSPCVGTPTRRPRRTKTARHYGTPPPTARTFMISSYVSSSTSTVVMTSSTSPRIMFKC